jgi:hypothetical protein
LVRIEWVLFLKIIFPDAHRHYFNREHSASVSFHTSMKLGIVAQKISTEVKKMEYAAVTGNSILGPEIDCPHLQVLG